MKGSRFWILTVPLLLFTTAHYAQDIKVHEMIGKTIDQVIANYGEPAHQDRSNRAMECVFYKTKKHQIVFVANEGGVFQAEGSNYYSSKSSARKAMNKLISECIETGFSSDTLNVAEPVVVPTLGEWGMVLLAGLFMLVGFNTLRSRRYTV